MATRAKSGLPESAVKKAMHFHKRSKTQTLPKLLFHVGPGQVPSAKTAAKEPAAKGPSKESSAPSAKGPSKESPSAPTAAPEARHEIAWLWC